MNIPHDKFCVLPWVSIETSPIGTVRPCCLAEEEVLDDNGNKFHLHEANLKSIQDSEYMRDLRQRFVDGEQPSTCRKCWNEEASGRISKRMHTLDRLKHMIPPGEWTQDARPLMFLDLKLGNICNLKCRICGSWSSSTYATEEIHHLPAGADKKASHHYIMLRQGAWPRENLHFWQEIEHVISDIRYIEFTGGEPFMIDEHFDLLETLVKHGVSHQVEIHYNTNGTQYPKRGLQLWPHFKTVEIAFSIDDVGDRFEYQRSNAHWKTVNHNIERFRELRSKHPNIQLQVCTTVNIFNVYYLETVAQWNAQQGFDFIYWNMLHDAPYWSIANLPLTAKEQARQRLMSANVDDVTRGEFYRIISFMMAGADGDGKELRRQLALLDHRRDQDLSVVAPEWAKILEYAKT